MASGTINKMTAESGTGYCKMPDGTLMCWGTVSVAAGTWNVIATFPVPFADTGYTVVDTERCNTTIAINVLAIKTNVDRVSFGLTRNDLAFDIEYLAIGRWK